MPKHFDLNQGDTLPPQVLEALQQYAGTGRSNFRVDAISATQIRGQAATGSGQASIGINGLWRWRSTPHTITISGGAPGTMNLWVVCSANEFSDSPTFDADTTDYNWYLVALSTVAGAPTGNTPGGKPIAASRLVGTFGWNSSAITPEFITPVLEPDLEAAFYSWRDVVRRDNDWISSAVTQSFALQREPSGSDPAANGVQIGDPFWLDPADYPSGRAIKLRVMVRGDINTVSGGTPQISVGLRPVTITYNSTANGANGYGVSALVTGAQPVTANFGTGNLATPVAYSNEFDMSLVTAGLYVLGALPSGFAAGQVARLTAILQVHQRHF